jgi:16S rRNA U516 pseudouridylate synthase RsuA-like enzyme
MNEDTLNLEIRKFLKEVGITSQREIEKVVRSGKIQGNSLKLRMTLTSETAPLNHVVEGEINLGAK